MSIFNFFFKGKYKDKAPSEDEQSLNDLLRSMEREHYARVPVNFPYQIETAFDVIALMNDFKHIHHSVYADQSGQHYYKTKLGFTPVVVYNKDLENAKLHAELLEREKFINELEAQVDKLTALLKEQEEKKQEATERKPVNAMLMERFSKIVLTREANQVLSSITRLDNYIRNKLEDHDRQLFKPGQKIDFTNHAEVKKRLMLAMNFHDVLRTELSYVSRRFSSIREHLYGFLKKRY